MRTLEGFLRIIVRGGEHKRIIYAVEPIKKPLKGIKSDDAPLFMVKTSLQLRGGPSVIRIMFPRLLSRKWGIGNLRRMKTV